MNGRFGNRENCLDEVCDILGPRGYQNVTHLAKNDPVAALGRSLPEPTSGDASEDPIIQRYNALATEETGFVARLLRR
jgi:hypothetical protein